MRLADRLNTAGVHLTIKADCSRTPGVVGTMPDGVALRGTAGDAADRSGDRAFYDDSDRRWYPVGPGPSDLGA